METEQIRECVKRSIEEGALVEFMMVIAQLKKLFTENNIELTKENLDIALSISNVKISVIDKYLYATTSVKVINEELVVEVLKRHAQIKEITFEI